MPAPEDLRSEAHRLLPKESAPPSLRDRIGALRERDNYRNFFYLGGVYLVIALTLGGTIWFWEHLQATGGNIWWALPVTLAAIAVIGASQHQLGGAMHEASHYMLFRNRLLNELICDWLCAFPIYVTTHNYRTVHFAHHLHANDREHDPEILQMIDSDNWPKLPQPRRSVLKELARELMWVQKWVRFTGQGLRDYALGFGGPLFREDVDKRWRRAGWLVFLAYAALTPPLLGAVILLGGGALLLGAVMTGLWAATALFFALMPERGLALSTVPTVISARVTAVSRVTFIAMLYAAVYWAEYFTGILFGNYLILLWVLPIFTTFGLFMVLRTIAQHGNRDTERFTAARVSVVNPLVVYALFPFGNAYHLPHHLYASVPHYRLKQLHELLMEDPAYARPDVQTRGLMHAPLGKGDAPGLIDALGMEIEESAKPHAVG